MYVAFDYFSRLLTHPKYSKGGSLSERRLGAFRLTLSVSSEQHFTRRFATHLINLVAVDTLRKLKITAGQELLFLLVL